MSLRLRAIIVFPCLMILMCLAPHRPEAQAGGGFTDRPEIPDTPAGARAREFLAVMNDGDDAALLSFLTAALAPSYLGGSTVQDQLPWFQGVRSAHGRLAFKAVRELEGNPLPGSVVVIVRSGRSDRWLGLMIGVEADPPHRITSLTLNTARPVKEAAPASTITAAQFAAEMRSYLSPLAAKQAFSGSVLVAAGDEVLFSEAFGEADRERHIPNDVETRFGLSSMGKMFTAVAIAQLADAGKLSFDDKVSRYLGDDWLPAGARDTLTIRHLLSHTGGTGDFLGSVTRGRATRPYLEVSDYRPLVAGTPLAFAPGTEFRYSNSGFLLLGAIIEKVSGKRYEDYLSDAVWGPAGMKRTACLDRGDPGEAQAIGYYREVEEGRTVWKSNAGVVTRKGSPAGGCFSSVVDLRRFERALRSGRLVTPATLDEMWREQSPKNPSMRYGLGFILEGTAADRVVGHGGTFPGANGAFDIFLDRDAVVIVLANGDGVGSARDRARELLARLAK